MTTTMHDVKLTTNELDGLNSDRQTRLAELREQTGFNELLLDSQGEKAQQAFEDGEHGASEFKSFAGFATWLTEEARHSANKHAARSGW